MCLSESSVSGALSSPGTTSAGESTEKQQTMAYNPQIAAHRGFKAKYAENTLAAFRGALEVPGVLCIETDIQTSSDGVLMINHDPSTGRVYSENLVIAESTVEQLQKLTHKQDPTQRMITFVEFLQWFVKETPEKMQVMLDIKANNDVTVLVKIVRALKDVVDDLEYWKKKVIFGLWQMKFYEFGVESGSLKGFEIINITISPAIAKPFLVFSKSQPPEYRLKAVSFLHIATKTPEFKTIRAELMAPYNVELYLWTLNSQNDFDQGYLLDCKSFITDDVVAASAAIEEFRAGKKPAYTPPPMLSLAGVKEMAHYRLYRFFEWSILGGYTKYKPVQLVLMFMMKFIAKGQK